MINKTLSLSYGAISYLLFFGVFNYTILFIGNILVTPSLDSIADSNLMEALLINMGLLGAFAIQHSIMARPAFKRIFTRIIPTHLERSTYVLASTILLASIVYFWQPLGGIIWQVTNPLAVGILYSVFALGWAILFASTFELNHFDLFGLRQVWLNFRGKPYTHLPFKTPFLYRYVRHPLYVGMMLGMWAAPTMSVAHLLFAVLSTGYILIGVRLEEKDLTDALPEYTAYKQQVPMFLPKSGYKQIARPATETANR